MKTIKMRRDAVEHRADGTGRRRKKGETYEVGLHGHQVHADVAKTWLDRGVATETTRKRTSIKAE